jgi:hypothetical protein
MPKRTGSRLTRSAISSTELHIAGTLPCWRFPVGSLALTLLKLRRMFSPKPQDVNCVP